MITCYTGDSLEVMRTLPAGSVNLVLCDPPYGTTLNTWDKLLPFDQLWPEYARLLAPGGCVVLFGSQPFTSAAVMSNPKWFRHELVWDKNKCGSPGLANKRPMKTHENLLVFSPGAYTYNPIMEPGEPYHRKTSNPEGYVGRCNNHKYGLAPKTEFHNEGLRYPKSVRRVSRDFSAQQQVHPTQKPVPLLRWLIGTYSNVGEMVLDNAQGSGSTGVAAVLEGRQYVGIDNEAGYSATAIERIREATSDSSQTI